MSIRYTRENPSTTSSSSRALVTTMRDSWKIRSTIGDWGGRKTRPENLEGWYVQWVEIFSYRIARIWMLHKIFWTEKLRNEMLRYGNTFFRICIVLRTAESAVGQSALVRSLKVDLGVPKYYQERTW